MWFPGPILRANRAQPDEVYGKSSHVVLSPTVSYCSLPSERCLRAFAGLDVLSVPH